jgi:hypothetical protein
MLEALMYLCFAIVMLAFIGAVLVGAAWILEVVDSLFRKLFRAKRSV